MQDFTVTHIEGVSYTHGIKHSLSGFNNIQNTTNPNIIGLVKNRFEEAIGIFKHKMEQSYNPFYWIEFILKLPQIILSYINFSPPDSAMKTIQLVYWITGLISALHNFKIIDALSWFN